ncbi:MAG: DHA2 family efflux MFS transporter permease subunit [Gemmatimonadaceae bacterium]
MSPSEGRYAHKYVIAATVTMAAMLELIDTSIVNVAIPHMMGNLGATLDEIAWVSTSYIIANVIVIPMSGWLSAYFGRKRYFTGSILLFTLASFFCGSSHSLLTLIFWRVIQGIGGGALLSTAQATLYESFPPEEAGTGMAIFGVGVMVGPTLGPTLGGWITDNYSWPWIFYINVPLGIIAAILTVTYVNDAEHQERADKIDYLGIVLLTLCVGSLQWMLERGERYDWWDSRFVTLLGVTALISGIALIWHELTIDEPVINLRILKSRQVSAGVSIALLLGFALYGSVFILPVFLQQLLQMTAWQTGKIILPGAIASAVTMAVVGRNAMRLDARYTVVAGAFLFFWSMLKMSHLTSASGSEDLFWPLILRGMGLGLIFVPLTNATMADLKVEDLAQGTGMFNLMRQLGGSLGIAVMATLLARFMASEKAVLVEHVGVNDPETLSRLSMIARGLVSHGTNPMTAQQQALAILDRQVTVQSSMLAFSRIYLYSGLVLLAGLPLLLLFRTGRARGSMGPVH